MISALSDNLVQQIALIAHCYRYFKKKQVNIVQDRQMISNYLLPLSPICCFPSEALLQTKNLIYNVDIKCLVRNVSK